jgi:hypothetical protein
LMDEPFLIIPLTLQRFVVPRSVLEASQELLAGPGEDGFEAVVLWRGRVVSAAEARVDSVYFPQQVVYQTVDGLAVEIPIDEWTDLALRLPPGQFVLAKLHTHPTHAYHSDVDAANPYLCHEGAMAITVPNFARSPLSDLDTCSVNVLRNGRWLELTQCEIRQTIRIEENAEA